ncbi:MAG: hypothetical protein JO130_18535 [Solirubrobacterales bacterium]|nr:hypothetical protein [Solirubrobacterales bacterium]
MSDIYDRMDPKVGAVQREFNRKRLAQLKAEGLERQRRLRLVAALHCHPGPGESGWSDRRRT